MIVWAGASVSPLQYSGNNLAVLQSVDKLLEISIYVECDDGKIGQMRGQKE